MVQYKTKIRAFGQLYFFSFIYKVVPEHNCSITINGEIYEVSK